jgi:hypothetical protein
MLADLGWLLRELEVTAARQDRLTVGTVRGAVSPSQMNFGADGLLGDVGIELQLIVSALGGAWKPASARARVWWLRSRLNALANLPNAHHYFKIIENWAGFKGSPGPIHDVINRPDKRFAGDCPDCGELCWARHHDDAYAVCEGCGVPIDVDRNRTRAIIEYDLLPERALLQVLDNLCEHVPRVRLYGWITSGKLPPLGYLGVNGIVSRRAGRHDPRVYSLDRARSLRRHELASRSNAGHTAYRLVEPCQKTGVVSPVP